MKCELCGLDIEYMDKVWWSVNDDFMCPDGENPHSPLIVAKPDCECVCHNLGLPCIAECKCGNETRFKGWMQEGLMWFVTVDPSSKIHEVNTDGVWEFFIENTGIIAQDDVVSELFERE